MKLLYRTFQWACANCGRFAYEARVPGDRDPKDYQPVECTCGSRRFTQREKGVAA